MAGPLNYVVERAEERLRPDLLVPGARSVIVVATTHAANADGPLPPGHGRVARYARGRDYHNVLGRRLKKLARWLRQELPGARIHRCIDTGPVLERSWAVQAGVAAPGKSGNVLRPGVGSWLLLGTLVVDRELPVDEPATDPCGACTACIDACPTDAIIAPGLVDARRCIACLNIELRGPVPRPLRPALGEWLFGCDECQTVCPHARELPVQGDPALAPLPGRAALDAPDLLASDDEGYHRRFHGSPLRRAGAAGMRRNAALRLGNEGDPGRSGLLARALCEDPSPVVRGACAWALGRTGGRRARGALERRHGADDDPAVEREIELALSGL